MALLEICERFCKEDFILFYYSLNFFITQGINQTKKILYRKSTKTNLTFYYLKFILFSILNSSTNTPFSIISALDFTGQIPFTNLRFSRLFKRITENRFLYRKWHKKEI